MTKFKTLLMEAFGDAEKVETMSAKDIYNFYFLWYTATNQPKLVATPYGKETMMHYLTQLRTKYVRLFKKLLAKQIAKYIQRGRVDPDFPKDALPQLQSMPATQLQTLMAKTFRSDMQRRNDKWDMVADFVTKLESASTPKDMFVYINQLNNAVHNTTTKVMDKFPNYYSELVKAFDHVDKVTNPHLQLKGLVDKDLRDLWNQEEEGDPHETDPSGEGGQYVERIMMREGLEKLLRLGKEKPQDLVNKNSVAYKSGVKMALKDKLSGTDREIDQLPLDFQAGYNSIRKTSMWDKLNDRLTNLAAMFGRSYGDRF